MAVGVPIEPLMLLIAVENIPDIVRTVGNVTMDVAATATIARRSGYAADQAVTEQDRLLDAPT
jgi:Na+/H+-dicarboxylate symporter